MLIEFTKYIEETGEEEEVSIELPSKKKVCHDCQGHGSVLNESMRYHAYTQEEFEESFDDPEDRAEYFKRGGIYDVICPTCKGDNVIDAVDEKHLNTEQKKIYKEYCKLQADIARDRADDARTMRGECGYMD